MVSNTKKYVATARDFQRLLDRLAKSGTEILGPTIRDGAVVYDAIDGVKDLPVGWTERQDGGRYRLEESGNDTLFGYVVGPQSWKKFLYPSVRRLLTAVRKGRQFDVAFEQPEGRKMAFIGVRSCELAALDVLDKVLIQGSYVDSLFRKLREHVFIVAVNCTRAGDTCFCTSMGTGPQARGGYDVAITEVTEDGSHFLLMEDGSERGREMLDGLEFAEASTDRISSARKAVEKAAGEMGRGMDSEGLGALLSSSFDDAHWDEIADRCLTCGNCTMVCPTCFCVDVEDTTDLTGDEAYRTRRLDSCYSVNFSYIHGGSIRASETSRYRQWMMHKLSYWLEQFGVSGCVGCGRCITWCPVGIDITEEAAEFRKRKSGVR